MQLKTISLLVALFIPMSAWSAYPPEIGGLIEYAGYNDCAAVSEDSNGVRYIAEGDWTCADPEPTEQEWEAMRIPFWAETVTAKIDSEQEVRSVSVVGFQMPQKAFSIMEELYSDILNKGSRKNIDEVDTPIWWGLKELRDNRNVLINGLQDWVAQANDDPPTKTAEDIRDFDVQDWSGWAFPRP